MYPLKRAGRAVGRNGQKGATKERKVLPLNLLSGWDLQPLAEGSMGPGHVPVKGDIAVLLAVALLGRYCI